MLTLYLCDLLVLCGATGACDWLQHSSGVYLSVRQNVQCNRTPRVCADPVAQRALEVASAWVWASARSIVCAKVSLCTLQCVCGWGASTVAGVANSAKRGVGHNWGANTYTLTTHNYPS
jgi:hypothetical protein